MDEILVPLDGDAGLALQELEIDIGNDVISFEAKGALQELDEILLSDLRGKTLEPLEIRFKVSESD